MKKSIMIVFALTMALFLGACGDKSEEAEPEAIDGSQIEVDPADAEMSEEEKLDEDEIVVSVNGNEITGDAYNDLYAQTKSILAHQGQDTSDKEMLQEQVVNSIIERELLSEEAETEGITVTEEDVEEFKAENEERYNGVLEQYNLSAKEYDKQLAFELLIEQYITAVFPQSDVTEEEILGIYEEAKEADENVPELEEVEDQIKEMFVMQQLSEKIQQLKEKAEIEMNL